MCEEASQDFFGFLWEGGFAEGVVHQLHPAIPGGGVHGERIMAHAEAGVASLFDVTRWAAEAENEEVAETLLGSCQVVLRIHWPEDVVRGDLAIKG